MRDITRQTFKEFVMSFRARTEFVVNIDANEEEVFLLDKEEAVFHFCGYLGICNENPGLDPYKSEFIGSDGALYFFFETREEAMHFIKKERIAIKALSLLGRARRCGELPSETIERLVKGGLFDVF